MMETTYETRVKQLDTWKQQATNKELIQKYELLIYWTHMAAGMSLKLIDAFEASVDLRRKFVDRQYNRLVAGITDAYLENERLIAEFALEEEGAKRAVLRYNAAHQVLTAKTLEMKKHTFEIEQELYNAKLDAGKKLHRSLFDAIFKPDQSGFSVDLVMNVLEAAIGMTPVLGTVFDILKRTEYQMEKRIHTDEHLNYLEHYGNALLRWILLTEKLMENLEEDVRMYSETD